jgi:hypothetical protein
MLWNKVLLIFDGSEASLRAVEFVAKILGKTEGLRVTIFGLHERIPRHDLKDSSPVVDKLQASLTTMELEVERGQARLYDSKKLLAKSGVDDSAIGVKFIERKSSALKDILAEAESGGYGTVVLGRSEHKGGLLTGGGDVAKDLAASAKGRAVIVV